jgi:hypothetical protein
VTTTQPDPSNLLKRIGLTIPLIGFYDPPDPAAFEPLVLPSESTCVFAYYKSWLQGETLHITKEHYGCGGAGRWMCGVETRSRKEFISFLVDTEGLKASRELMEMWIDSGKLYKSKYPNTLIGPLKADQWPYLKSVTFFADPDQLSALMTGAQYHSKPSDPPPVVAPFGSGCMLLLPFDDVDIPQAAIGAVDMAMRHYLSPGTLAFVATKPMFERLCALDERSFLYKGFWEKLRRSRGLPELD